MKLLDWGKIEYLKAWAGQEKLVKERLENERGEDLVILAEHESVYTIGRRGSKGNILVGEDRFKEMGIPVHEVDRGGDITYHGPGQLMAYFIFHLKLFNYDVHDMIRWMEEVVIKVLKEYGLEGYRVPGKSGVWCNGKKIASLGLGFRRWVSSHGLAFNINPDLKFFSYIHPCGLRDVEMTSLVKELGEDVTVGEVKKYLTEESFALEKGKCRVFSRQ